MNILYSFFIIFSYVYVDETNVSNTSNISILDSLTISLIAGDLKNLPSANGDSLAIDASRLDRDVEDYLQVLFGNIATEKSFNVFRNYNSASTFQGMVLVIYSYYIDIKYSEPFEKSFLGEDYVNRHISIKLKGQIYSVRSNNIVTALDKEINYTDMILYEDIEWLEKSAYKFTTGTRGDYSFWDKYFEPALAITSVAVIVYLFFTQRT
jgi:hypothetical protein